MDGNEGVLPPSPITSTKTQFRKNNLLSANDTMSQNSRNILNNLKYSDKILPPYVVVAQFINSDKNIGALHPMQIGKKLMQNNVKGITEIKRKGKNRLNLIFNSAECANNFLDNEILQKEGYNLFIPRHLVSCQGVVRRVDPTLPVEEIQQNINSNMKILHIRRIHRKDSDILKPTGTIVITFEGTILPKFINLYLCPEPVEAYVLPVIQCMKCLIFGHTKDQCRSKERCARCGLEEEFNHSYNSCDKDIKCYNCAGSHLATERVCAEYKRQRIIKDLMSFENISQYDANLRIPKTKFYADPEVHNKNYKNYQSLSPKKAETEIENTFLSPQHFPPLHKEEERPQEETITIDQRRQFSQNNEIKSYRKAILKRKAEKHEDYDKVAHKALIIANTPSVFSSGNTSIYEMTEETRSNEIEKTIFFLRKLMKSFNVKIDDMNTWHKITKNLIVNKSFDVDHDYISQNNNEISDMEL